MAEIFAFLVGGILGAMVAAIIALFVALPVGPLAAGGAVGALTLHAVASIATRFLQAQE